MTNRRHRAVEVALAALWLAPCVARGAEGMFLLDRLPDARLQQSGLKIPLAELQSLAQAVVRVGLGGTAAFVSDSGLLLTNHHVAFACLARLNSSPEHRGVMERGHYARTVAEELPCPGYDLLVIERIEDVTAQLRDGLPQPNRANYPRYFELVRRRVEQLTRQCEMAGQNVCEVSAMDGGTSYYRTAYRRVRDVRLVYAPPKSLGKFGGDIDNWAFPRHTADFTFLRAYVDAAGNATGYDRRNLPLSTPHFLRVSPHGVRRRLLTMVIGFPGRTLRHATSHALSFYSQLRLPDSIALFQGMIDALAARSQASEEARRKYESLDAGLQNALKYYQMSRDGFERWNVLETKRAAEEELLAAAGPPGRRLLAEIGGIYRGYRRIYTRYSTLGRLTGLVPSLRTAYDIVRWAADRPKPPAERKDERYLDKNAYRFIEQARRLDQDIEPATERALAGFLLQRTARLPPTERLESARRLLGRARQWLARDRRAAQAEGQSLATYHQRSYHAPWTDDPLQRAVDMTYGATKLIAHSAEADEVARARRLRQQLLRAKRDEVERFDDPLLDLARDLEREQRALRDGPYRLVEQYLEPVLHPRWVELVKRPPYPDANSTVRLSYGSVRDYVAEATSKRYRYLTSLGGLLAKDRGKWPFLVPGWLKRAAAARTHDRYRDPQIGDIPVDFTATLDTTGGNSGSPVLDDHGRLVGLLFDGTPESILSDWQYLPDDQRSICVDVRFVLYLARTQRAVRVLAELGASPAGHDQGEAGRRGDRRRR